jgi:hypothetical protein
MIQVATAMLWTGLAAGLTAFIPLATGWANNIAQGNPADPSVLRSAGISAAAAALGAVISAVTVLLRKQAWFPAEPPTYG